MALSKEEKALVVEYVAGGIIAREIADRLLSGRITKAEMSLFRSIARIAGRTIGAGLARAPGTAVGLAARAAGAGRFFAMQHPILTAGTIIYVGYHQRERIAALLSQGYEILDQPQFGIQDPGEFGTVRPGPMAVYADPAVLAPKVKRAISKANRAVKKGMQILKSGGKKATGAKPGKLPKRAFIAATRAAGLANPKTMSKPGKAATVVNKLARKLIKWWKK